MFSSYPDSAASEIEILVITRSWLARPHRRQIFGLAGVPVVQYYPTAESSPASIGGRVFSSIQYYHTAAGSRLEKEGLRRRWKMLG